MVILKKNLFDVDATDIAEIKILATMIDGKYTYQTKN
jgi:predicted amidohydrolase YtcJ